MSSKAEQNGSEKSSTSGTGTRRPETVNIPNTYGLRLHNSMII